MVPVIAASRSFELRCRGYFIQYMPCDGHLFALQQRNSARNRPVGLIPAVVVCSNIDEAGIVNPRVKTNAMQELERQKSRSSKRSRTRPLIHDMANQTSERRRQRHARITPGQAFGLRKNEDNLAEASRLVETSLDWSPRRQLICPTTH